MISTTVFNNLSYTNYSVNNLSYTYYSVTNLPNTYYSADNLSNTYYNVLPEEEVNKQTLSIGRKKKNWHDKNHNTLQLGGLASILGR